MVEKGKKTTKTKRVRNIDKREKFIEQYGKGDKKAGFKKFYELGERDENWKKLRDIPCPSEYRWIFRHFLMIWQNAERTFAGEVIFTFRTINEYVECMKVPLTIDDKKRLFRMKFWALDAIAELEEDKE